MTEENKKEELDEVLDKNYEVDLDFTTPGIPREDIKFTPPGDGGFCSVPVPTKEEIIASINRKPLTKKDLALMYLKNLTNKEAKEVICDLVSFKMKDLDEDFDKFKYYLQECVGDKD